MDSSNNSRPVSQLLPRIALGVALAALLGGGIMAWTPWQAARAYRDSITVVFEELDRLQAERHRIAGLPPPKDRYAVVTTQTELETLEAKQTALSNTIAKRIQDQYLNSQALAALQFTERKITDLRMAFEVRRKERLERFASTAVQRGCHWIRCPEPFTLPGEAMLIKMKAENPDFGKIKATKRTTSKATPRP
jgi:hypothetical protein